MSASIITTQVRLGEETAQAVASRRAAMLAERARAMRDRERVHQSRLGGADATRRELAQLNARIDVVAQHTSQRALATARAQLKRATDAEQLEQARRHVERAERDADQRWTARAHQEAAVEQIAEGLADGSTVVSCRTGQAADGSPQVLARLDSGRELPLVARGGADGVVAVDWEVERSGISAFRTPSGVEVDCAAQEAFVRAYSARLSQQDLDVRVEGQAVAYDDDALAETEHGAG